MTMTRSHNAATVSDEHGKGVEILRQAVAESTTNVTRHLMVAEVDMVIRGIKVTRGAGNTAGAVRVSKRTPGAAADVHLTAVYDVDAGISVNAVGDVPLTAANNVVKRGDIVKVTFSAMAGGAASVHLLWMPDLFGQDANPRTYTIP